jgi:hypothetical protein
MESFNKRLDRTIRYPVQQSSFNRAPTGSASPSPEPTAQPKKPLKYRKIKQRAVIQHEAHALANLLLGRTDLPRIIETQQLFTEDPPPSP